MKILALLLLSSTLVAQQITVKPVPDAEAKRLKELTDQQDKIQKEIQGLREKHIREYGYGFEYSADFKYLVFGSAPRTITSSNGCFGGTFVSPAAIGTATLQ